MKNIYTALLLLAALSAFPQGNYSLFYFKGKVESSADQKTWQVLTKLKTIIPSKSFIRLGDQSEAIFTGDSGGVYRVNTKGVYPAKDLLKYRMGRNAQSSASVYFNYLVDEMTRKEESAETNYTEHLKNVGGVERGKYAACLSNPGNGSYIMDTMIAFRWKDQGRASYLLIIYEDERHEIEKFNETVSDTFYLLDRQEAGLKAGKMYWWTIVGKGMKPCEIWSFRVLQDLDIATIRIEHKKLLEELNYTPGMNKALEAKFYETKGLFGNAAAAYDMALRLEPGNTLLMVLNANFQKAMMGK